MADKSVFARTSRIFENVRACCLTKHEIELPPATQLIQTSSRLFQLLDRTDPLQADVSRRLWVLRSSILFTVLPFDDPALRLLRQVTELEQSTRGLPDTSQLIESLKECVTNVVSTGRNPKREWLLRMLAESIGKDIGKIGLLSALSAGNPPGWPLESPNYLPVLSDEITLIRSRRHLTSNVFGMVILPCACRNTPSALLSILLFCGRAANLEVLLYPGERFQLPKRLTLPSDDIFAGKLQKTEIEREVILVPVDKNLSAVDTWMNEAFWQGIHGAARHGSSHFVPAHYMLFCDGKGTFLPVNGRVLTLPKHGLITDESDLSSARVEDVCEGDFVVLRSGDSGSLLDEASDRIINHSGNENLFEMATDWKESLEALLVTQSKEEVAQALRERGVATSAASIHQWTGPDVLGPGNERVFKELIYFLANKGKIQKEGDELISYAVSRWNSLQDLRGVRQKAGNQIRHEMFKVLFSRFGKDNCRLSDRESIHIEGDAGAELLVLRVSAVDSNTAHVNPTRLGQMDDLRGNKWLG